MSKKVIHNSQRRTLSGGEHRKLSLGQWPTRMLNTDAGELLAKVTNGDAVITRVEDCAQVDEVEVKSLLVLS